jgi:hypothetical protein
MPAQTDEPTGSSFEAPSPEVRATTGECKGLKIPVSCRFSKGRDPSSLSFSEPWDPRPGGFAEAFPPHVTPRYVPVRPALGGSPPAMMDSVTGPPHSAAPGSDRAYAPSERLSGRTIRTVRAGCHLRRPAHMASRSVSCWQPSCLNAVAGGRGRYASRIQTHGCDDVPAFPPGRDGGTGVARRFPRARPPPWPSKIE